MQIYSLEFILSTAQATGESIRNSITEFGENLEITPCQDDDERMQNFKVCVDTEDPTVIFDICAQFGRIKSVKIDEEGDQVKP